jgi:hypothetical protein
MSYPDQESEDAERNERVVEYGNYYTGTDRTKAEISFESGWNECSDFYRAGLAAREPDLAEARLAAVHQTLNEHSAPTHDKSGAKLNANGRLVDFLAAREEPQFEHGSDCAIWDSQQPYGTPDCTCERER